MPTKQLSESQPGAGPGAAVSSYNRLLAFFDLATGFNLAVARCNIPALRWQLIGRAIHDAGERGVHITHISLSGDANKDFVTDVKESIRESNLIAPAAVMVTGIDPLIYKASARKSKRGDGRPAFVARLNFDRERLARELPHPLVLWLESEALNLFLKEAPDLAQWISAQFDFGGPAAEIPDFPRFLRGQPELPSKISNRALNEIGDLDALLSVLKTTRRVRSIHGRRRRFSAWYALGERYFWLGNADDARKAWMEALKLSKRLDDRRGEGNALGNLGLAYADLGETRKAIEFYVQHLAIAREIGDRRGEGSALGNLGVAYARLGETRKAIEVHQQALAIAREIGGRQGEGSALGNLGNAYAALGETRKAISMWEQALKIFVDIEDPNAAKVRQMLAEARKRS